MTTPKPQPTPGPYKVIPSIHGEQYLVVALDEKQMYTTLEMKPADAHLLAASWDLLQACRASLACMYDDDPIESTIDGVEAQLRAAIAKAEGGTQP